MGLPTLTSAQADAMNRDHPALALIGINFATYVYETIQTALATIESELATVEGFSQNISTTTGLDYGYKAGIIQLHNGTIVSVAAGTVTLTNSTTNYVEVNAAGTVSANTSGFTSTSLPLATIVTSGGTISTVTNKRGAFALLGDNCVRAADLNSEIRTYVPKLTHSVAAESGNNIDVTIQVKDVGANNIAAIHLIELWVADSATGGLCASAPNGGITVTTGTQIQSVTLNKHIRACTDANGTLVVRVTDSGTPTFYLRAQVAGQMYTSGAITFA